MTKKPTGYEYTALYIRVYLHKNLSTNEVSPEKYLEDDVYSLVKGNIVSAQLDKVTSNDAEAIYDIRLNFAASKMIDIETQSTLEKIKSLEYISHAYIKEANKD